MASALPPALSNGTRDQYSEQLRAQFERLCEPFRYAFEDRLIGPSTNSAQQFLRTDEASLQLSKGRDELEQLYNLTYGSSESSARRTRKATKPTAKRPAKRRRTELPTPPISSETNSENDTAQARTTGENDERNTNQESRAFVEAVLGQETKDGVVVNAKVKILAILMRIGVTIDSKPWQNFVRRTMNKDDTNPGRFCDQYLPFRKEHIIQYFGNDKLLNACFFYEQYLMCAPVIKKSKRSQIFPENTVWPFEQVKEIESVSGRKPGTLSKVKVAAGHCEVETNNGWLFKKDLDHNARDADMARQLSGNRHKHDNIIGTRAIIEQDGTTSILMECGDGTLHELMSDQDLSGTRFSNGSGFDEKLELLKQYIDVGKALSFLHHELDNPDVPGEKLLGIHGDYGPKNVLVVKSSKTFTLKLSDYGISLLLRPSASENTQRPSLTQGEQCECIPPEGLDLIHPDCLPSISEKYDVWAYACVLLMYLAWLWNGKEGYNNFREIRDVHKFPLARQPRNERFFEISGSSQSSNNTEYTTHIKTEDCDRPATFRINNGVVRFFEGIRDSKQRPKESKLYWNMFEAIRAVALLPDPTKRKSMLDVCNRLEQVISESRALQR